MSNLKQVEIGNHILAIYQNQESEFDEAFKFLKDGLDNDEIIMIITDRLSKDKIRNRMKKEWGVKVEPMESIGIINIKTTQEWYYDHGFPDTVKISSFWITMTQIAKMRNRRGLRVFADTHNFFQKAHGDNLVNYESTLDSKFDFPLTAICAYDSKDFESLTPLQRAVLTTHHNTIWK
jgi:hypothetical protein